MITKILIISTNREFSPQPVAPYGAAWVAEALHQAGFEVKLLDLTFEKYVKARIADELNTFRPHGIGLSVRNVDNGDFLATRSFLPELRDTIAFIREHSDARMLLGGSGISVMPDEILDYTGADYAVVGEGEEAAVMFFRARDEAEYCRVPGLVCRRKPDADRERCWLANPDLVRPRTDRWLDVRRYLRYEPVLPVQGKRGCANRCLYCTYYNIEGKSFRLREPAVVAEEISNLILSTKARKFEFVDSIFNQPEGYMEALLEELIKWKLKAKFHVSSMSPKGLTKAHIQLLERAGFESVGITPDSASDKMLASYRKGFADDEVYRTAELFKGSKIKALWCFLLGGPGEDEASVDKTITFINKYAGGKDRAFVSSGIRIYPRTGMHEVAIREGCISANDGLVLPKFYFSSRITPDETRKQLLGGLRSIGGVIFLSDTNFASLGLLRQVGTAMHLPSPFWSYSGMMNLMLTGKRIVNKSWPKP